MDSIYKKIIEKEKSNTIITTCINLQGEGNIKEFKRELDSDILSASEKEEILKKGIPACINKKDRIIFAEPLYKKERLIIFGGGHISLALSKIAELTGFYTVIIDDRPSFANKARFKEADEVICDSFETCLEKIHPLETDYFVIVTRGHRHDKICIEQLMKYNEPVYTGMIGSRKRTKILLGNLAEEGFDENRLKRINTPIGLSIGAVTAEEIAVSIMAEIIKRKRLETDGNFLINKSDLEEEIIKVLAENTEAAAAATIMESHGSVPRNAGAKMVIYKDGRIKGTIGGGCVESSVIWKARDLIGTGKYTVIDVSLNGEDAMAEGMVCGGSLKILLEDLGGKDYEI